MYYLYVITNLINGKVYIGQTIKPKRRWATHKRIAVNPKHRYYNLHLYCAIRKYSAENFAFEEIACAIMKDDIDKCEDAAIIQYRSLDRRFGYNNIIGKQAPAISRPRPRKPGQTSWNKGLHTGNAFAHGYTHSKETVAKLRAKNKEREKLTDQQAEDIRKKFQDNPKWGIITSLANEYNVGRSTIDDIVKNRSHPSGSSKELTRKSRLNKNDVKTIRARYENENITHKKLAEEYGVNKTTISLIISRKTWTDI